MNTPEGEATMATIQSMREHTKQVYSKIVEKGGELPTDGRLNLQNLAPTIRTIKQGGGDGTLWGTLYTTQYPDGLVLNSKADYDALGANSATPRMINGVSITLSTITGFSFGSACSYTPEYFLSHCVNLITLDYAEVLREIERDFLDDCISFDSTLDLSNIVSYSMNFMFGCRSFSKPLKIPKTVVRSGAGFMYNCQQFTGPLIIETTSITAPTDQSTLSTNNSSTPMYTTGVTITGSGASQWRSALPDRAIKPFRKLILVEDKNG